MLFNQQKCGLELGIFRAHNKHMALLASTDYQYLVVCNVKSFAAYNLQSGLMVSLLLSTCMEYGRLAETNFVATLMHLLYSSAPYCLEHGRA
jgi:hypothetical protein